MHIPPGILYLSQRLPALLAPATFTYICASVACPYFGFHVSKYIVLLMCLLALPVALLVSVMYDDYLNARHANGLGAVMPPQVRDRWPGGLSLLAKGLRHAKAGYPGRVFFSFTCFFFAMAPHGNNSTQGTC